MNEIEQNNRTPLIERSLQSPLAFRTDNRGSLYSVTGDQFLADVVALAERLPSHPVAINICQDRYHFAVAFCAVIVRGQANALPPSHHGDVQRRIADRAGDCYLLHDGVDELADLPHFNLIAEGYVSTGADPRDMTDKTAAQATGLAPTMPLIPLSQLSAICFTSGSTGEPTATHKSWRTLIQSSRINHRHYLRQIEEPASVLATVPPQHMYGLEATILLPLVAEVAVHHAKPLFPADIADRLGEMPAPRVLVSTPVHMQALINANVALSPTRLCLSATAPLSTALADAVAAKTGAKMREIYGCSEAGSMATRDLLDDSLWLPFDGFHFSQQGDQTLIEADHLLSAVELQDRIEFMPSGGFSLLGRQSDMVNIAGKRGSLTHLTSLLVENPEVQDAVVFVPDNAGASVSRLAALVVSDSHSARPIQAWLRQRTDHAFVPRSIVFVDELPRSTTGKLPRSEVLRLYDSARKKTDAT